MENISRGARPQAADLDALANEVLRLHDRVLSLEDDLAQASTALDDPIYLSGRLEKLLIDQPDLRELARYIASSLRADAKGSPMG